jgi:hypothetical protein
MMRPVVIPTSCWKKLLLIIPFNITLYIYFYTCLFSYYFHERIFFFFKKTKSFHDFHSVDRPDRFTSNVNINKMTVLYDIDHQIVIVL